MMEWLERLLDLDRLSLTGEDVAFGFERPLAGWVWIGLTAASLLFAWLTYKRLIGRRAMRVTLAAVRALLLLLLVLLITGPQLIKETRRTEQDWLIVLVDRSASLGIADVEAAPNGAARTRDRQLRTALERSWPMWTDLSREREVLWLGFDAGAFDLPVGRDLDGVVNSVSLEEPRGQRTSIGRAMDQALARAAARPITAVVIISDGRSVDGVSRHAQRRLTAERIPVHTVALGSREPVGDVAIRRADGPRVAFVNDFTPVEVELERLGGQGPVSSTVRLLDRATREVLDEQRVTFEGSDAGGATSQVITLNTRSEIAGERNWIVEVEPDGRDLISGNNRAELRTELVDRPMRVLYIDGYPRWEQRYLKNLLLREASIESSSLLLASDRKYIQDGDVELDALPDSLEQWREFDVIVLGDVRPDVFTWDQLDQIREHIAVNGAGLIWIGGAAATPMAWWGTSLADVIPFTSAGFDGSTVGDPVLMQPSEVAERLGILRLGNDPTEGWPQALATPVAGWSQLRWMQHIRASGLKPITEVVAWAEPAYGDPEQATPAVMAMRYGAGRVIYVATDEIWRWRYGRGELLPERFWVQMIRLLGRESLARTGQSALLTVSPRRSVVDQPVRIEVELLDQSLIDREMGAVTIQVSRQRQAGEDDFEVFEDEVVLRPEGRDHRRFAAVWLPPSAGQWEVRARDTLTLGSALSGEAIVSLPDDELRRPETDHASLAAISNATEGEVIPPDELGDLKLRDRSVILRSEITESLWDTPLALILLMTLLTFEWVGRRLIKLL